MTEWNIVLVLAELIGLFVLVGKPILTLNKTIVEVNAELKTLKERQNKAETSGHEENEKLWQHNDMQDEKLSDHETRIRVLEHN
jgi:uncharacterized membrane protein (DUF106 family)